LKGCRYIGIWFFLVQGLGFRVKDFRCRVEGLGFRVQGAGFRTKEFAFRVQGAGCKVQVWGLGRRV